MKDAVVIKGNKAGMTVYLENDLDFDEVLQAIAKKFKATAKFWGAAQMTLTLEGRDLTPDLRPWQRPGSHTIRSPDMSARWQMPFLIQ